MHEIKKKNKRKQKLCDSITTKEHKTQQRSQGRLQSSRLKSSSQAATRDCTGRLSDSYTMPMIMF